MTEAEARTWVEELQTAMRLDHWTLTVRFKKLSKNTEASCTLHHKYDTATLTINTRLMAGWDRAGGRATIAHELAHVLTRELGDAERLVAKPLKKEYDLALEKAVDRIALVVTGLLE